MYYYGARYLDPKYSMWLSTDPALGEYIPQAPVNDEIRKNNQNLPGMGGIFNHINSNLYHYAGNNPIKYTDPDGRMDDVPSFEELDNEYKVTERKFLAICEVSDEFSSLTSLIVSGNKKIEEVFLSCYINNLEKSNEKCTNITDFESLKTDVGLLAAYTIKKFGNSQIKVGISIIKISLFFKKLDYQSELNNIEEKMKKEYPKQFENKFNPTYKFGGGGASGSW